MTSQSLMVTIPHSGEKVPDQAQWLKVLPETILMQDVDRYVDQLYEPTLKRLNIPFVKSEWHRYAGDLNRLSSDIDAGSVLGHPVAKGPHLRGFHWVITTKEEILMPQPMSQKNHEELVQLIYDPFHQSVQNLKKSLKPPIYHLDLHSMPSKGTSQHKDPGEMRADVVISDQLGKSSSENFRNLVITSFVTAGFKVGYNWPYVGGRITEMYGKPHEGHHTIQVELNRSLYMNETTKKLNTDISKIQSQLAKALATLVSKMPEL